MVKLFLCSQCCGSESRFGSASSILSARVPLVGRLNWLPLHRKRVCLSQDPIVGEGGHTNSILGKGGWGSQCRRRDRHYGTVLCILIPSLWDSRFHIPRLLMTQKLNKLQFLGSYCTKLLVVQKGYRIFTPPPSP